MADIQTVSIAVASTGVFVAAIYYIFQIRHQAKLRQTDMVMRLYSTLGTKEFHDALVEVYALQYKNYEDFEKKYGPWLSNGPAQVAMFVLGMYFQGVGLLLYKKAIDAGFTYNLMGFNSIKTCWEKSKPVVVKLREQLNDPGLFWGVEYLYSEMKKRQQLASKTA